MKHLFNLGNCCLLMILLTGCLGEIAPVCDSPMATLTQTWQLEQLTFNDSVVSIDSTYQEHIMANGQYFVDTPLGNTSYIKRRDGVWEFSAGQTQVIFDKGTITEVTADIITLECKQLVLAYRVEHPIWGKGVLMFSMRNLP